METEINFAKLRDCFTAGYTFPQFCIDNGIKKPLFISEKKFLNFVWEIYAQFRYDKRMTAQFSFLDMSSGEINLSKYGTLTNLIFYNISVVNVNFFDKIIMPCFSVLCDGPDSLLMRHTLILPCQYITSHFPFQSGLCLL